MTPPRVFCDTSVLVRYFAEDDPPRAFAAATPHRRATRPWSSRRPRFSSLSTSCGRAMASRNPSLGDGADPASSPVTASSCVDADQGATSPPSAGRCACPHAASPTPSSPRPQSTPAVTPSRPSTSAWSPRRSRSGCSDPGAASRGLPSSLHRSHAYSPGHHPRRSLVSVGTAFHPRTAAPQPEDAVAGVGGLLRLLRVRGLPRHRVQRDPGDRRGHRRQPAVQVPAHRPGRDPAGRPRDHPRRDEAQGGAGLLHAVVRRARQGRSTTAPCIAWASRSSAGPRRTRSTAG